MRHTRIVNRDHFIEWFSRQDDRFPRKVLASKTGLSSSLIGQMLCGRLPGEVSRRKIARAIGLAEDELFPVLNDQKKPAL